MNNNMRNATVTSPRLSALLLAALALLPFVAGGCLVTSDSSEHRSGNYVADSTFDQIRPGKTTEGWVDATLGKPTSVSHLADGTDIWKYSYTERRDSSGAVFLIFGGSSSSEKTHTAFVEIKDGIVRNAWRG
jgi:outer membrane protein assembly factor BamE (lipoprotein component of BamABCDE complex)